MKGILLIWVAEGIYCNSNNRSEGRFAKIEIFRNIAKKNDSDRK